MHKFDYASPAASSHATHSCDASPGVLCSLASHFESTDPLSWTSISGSVIGDLVQRLDHHSCNATPLVIRSHFFFSRPSLRLTIFDALASLCVGSLSRLCIALIPSFPTIPTIVCVSTGLHSISYSLHATTSLLTPRDWTWRLCHRQHRIHSSAPHLCIADLVL